MKKYPVYIAHNAAGWSNPSAVSMSANEVVFDMKKISESLRLKVYGQIGIVELTRAEMQEILDANTGIRSIRRVGHRMMVNIGLKKD